MPIDSVVKCFVTNAELRPEEVEMGRVGGLKGKHRIDLLKNFDATKSQLWELT
jgi:hypothetical protein